MRRVNLNEGFDFDAWQSRQSSKPKTQMAGDRVEQLLAEYKRDLDLESDAIQYLSNKAADLKALGLLNSQQTLAQADAPVQSLQRMTGNVPMPLVKILPNGEVRKHVEYAINPVTGVEEIIPYLDPDDKRKVLETIYGPAGIDSAAGHQAEPAMLNALKLEGKSARYNDPEGKGLADLAYSTDDDITKRIDVMVATEGKPIEIPMYTNLWPRSSDGRQIRTDAYDIALDLVKKQLAKQGNNDYQKAVTTLVNQNKLGPSNKAFSIGKLLKGDRSVSKPGEHFYDGLLVPAMSPSVMSVRGNAAPQRTPRSPDAIYKVDLQKASDALSNGIDGANVVPVVNYGYGRKGHQRLQLKPQFNVNDDVGIVDATIESPLLQQLLSPSAMQKRIV